MSTIGAEMHGLESGAALLPAPLVITGGDDEPIVRGAKGGDIGAIHRLTAVMLPLVHTPMLRVLQAAHA